MQLNRVSTINEIIWRPDPNSDTARIDIVPLNTFRDLKYLHVIEPHIDDFNYLTKTCRQIPNLTGLAIDVVDVDVPTHAISTVKIISLHTKTPEIVRVFSNCLQELCFTFVGSTCDAFIAVLCDTKLDIQIEKMFLDVSSVNAECLLDLLKKVLSTQKQLRSLRIYCGKPQNGIVSKLLTNQPLSTLAVTIYSNQKHTSMFTFDGRLGGCKYQSDWLMQCEQCKQIL
eukprot:18063_1